MHTIEHSHDKHTILNIHKVKTKENLPPERDNIEVLRNGLYFKSCSELMFTDKFHNNTQCTQHLRGSFWEYFEY